MAVADVSGPGHPNIDVQHPPILRMPPELRIQIYQHIFRDQSYPVVELSQMAWYSSSQIEDWREQKSSISVLQTCRQCRAEATPIFHELVTVHFNEVVAFDTGLPTPPTILDRSQFKTMEITSRWFQVSILDTLHTTCLAAGSVHLVWERETYVLRQQRVAAKVDADLTPSDLVHDIDAGCQLFLNLLNSGDVLNPSSFNSVQEIWLQILNSHYSGPEVSISTPVLFGDRDDVQLSESDAGRMVFFPRAAKAQWHIRDKVLEATYRMPETLEEGAWRFEHVANSGR